MRPRSVVCLLTFLTSALPQLGYAQTSKPNFAPAVTYGSGGGGQSAVAVADVNGDGKPDVMVATSCGSGGCYPADGGVRVLLGNGDGTFQAAVTYKSGGYDPHSVAVADVNGDGKPDLVVPNVCVSSQTVRDERCRCALG